MKENIALIHNEPIAEGEANWESSLDVMAQVEAIETALADLGHQTLRIPFTRDLGRFIRDTEKSGISLAFNLCESVDDNPQFMAHPAAVLELLNIPFTGSPAAALMTTTDKHLVKLALRGSGLRTPAALLFSAGDTADFGKMRFPVILKPQFQDASIGIDQESVITDPRVLPKALRQFHDTYGPIVVEEYIDGREFNISLLGNSPPQALPAAEIDFSGFPDNLFKIVGYRAKWEPESLEYQETKRKFPLLDDSVRQKMSMIAVHCHHLFGLRDYGRIDLRLDADGNPYVLEINANPCLSPDAGFPAAVRQGGLDYTAMVAQLLSLAEDRKQ